ncbi:MAG: glycosyltransferase [Sporocytophaga sp.]|uniref:glycosyltransferase n=1 Tax=Sporocytophaga sp. TaxID=2231183 RepID=UPI001B07D59E|nr:glycosyltransferase [Sporocytophaga sp.]MBO9703202.1 glycosyltransferase [Sporocytophaga sp.]
MSKTAKILLASVLKPVNETRMYEKFAKSLLKLNDVEIHIAGFSPTKNATSENRIFFHTLFSASRLHISRFSAQIKLLKLLLKVKPQLVIITTHEILLVSILYKIISGTVLIYDVQENYYRNIRFTPTFPPFVRNIIASGVRLFEILTRPFIDFYFLAERNYESEFSFTRNKSCVVENKFKNEGIPPVIKQAFKIKPNKGFRFLYSGTISEVYGIFKAIDLIKKLHKIDSNITLTVIGYSPKKEILNKLKSEIKDYPFINLIGGDSPVAHSEILKQIKNSDIGILSYVPNKSTENCIPTKLYEYLSLYLPMIIPSNHIWTSITDSYNAAITYDFNKSKPEDLLEKLKQHIFYTSQPENITWDSEEIQFLQVINNYLNN